MNFGKQDETQWPNVDRRASAIHWFRSFRVHKTVMLSMFPVSLTFEHITSKTYSVHGPTAGNGSNLFDATGTITFTRFLWTSLAEPLSSNIFNVTDVMWIC